MRLFIAEKYSLGTTVAENLGVTQNNRTFLTCGSDVVTWCHGHLLEPYDPNDYDENLRTWRRCDLPIVPTEWKLKTKKGTITQLQVIGNLLNKASSVVNVGDLDREGQLLVDEVLEHFNYRGPVFRLWAKGLDPMNFQKALATMKDNKEYIHFHNSALARSRADWLVGINATRALTLFGRESGREGVLSLGRVQTPTLAIVVQRDREIEAFKPIDYLILQATVRHETGTFIATFAPMETQTGLDSEGRLVDSAVAQSIVEAVRGRDGHIVEMSREKKRRPLRSPTASPHSKRRRPQSSA